MNQSWLAFSAINRLSTWAAVLRCSSRRNIGSAVATDPCAGCSRQRSVTGKEGIHPGHPCDVLVGFGAVLVERGTEGQYGPDSVGVLGGPPQCEGTPPWNVLPRWWAAAECLCRHTHAAAKVVTPSTAL